MKNNRRKKGFTLIELLVVVLIIGILAAIAVPQYTQAINKARFANLKTLAMAYVRAAKLYRLTNGDWPTRFDELSVDAPGGTSLNVTSFSRASGNCAKNEDIFCCIAQQVGGVPASVTCGRNDQSFAVEYFFTSFGSTIEADRTACLANITNSKAGKLCQSMGTYAGTAWMLTPDGLSSQQCKFYTLP